MYIILNKSKRTTSTHVGDWPGDYLEGLLNENQEVIVISLYSNTIKVPHYLKFCGEEWWEWGDYKFDSQELISSLLKSTVESPR